MANGNILIVEDDPIIAMETTAYLQDMGFRVIGPAYNAQMAFDFLEREVLKAVLLDIDLGGELSGIDVAKRIRMHYRIPFIYITSFYDRSTLEEVKQTMPAGYIVKPFQEKDLKTTLSIALHNFDHLPKAPKNLTLELLNDSLVLALSQREFEVLELLYKGLSNKETAAQLYVSVNTLKTHLKNIFMKADVQSRTELIVKIRRLLA